MVGRLPDQHTRVIIGFSDGSHLYFNDQRKFGFVKLVQTEQVEQDDFVAKLGPEPWDKSLDRGGLYVRLQKHPKMMVKAAILDQTVLAGAGNIYADEGLFYAFIHPERRVGSLSQREVAELLKGLRESMEKSIAVGGSSLRNYVKADGSRGDYLDQFAQVYNRTGAPCHRCGTPIQKIRAAGRGTHFCPTCQKI